jgi:hypothetical protein
MTKRSGNVIADMALALINHMPFCAVRDPCYIKLRIHVPPVRSARIASGELGVPLWSPRAKRNDSRAEDYAFRLIDMLSQVIVWSQSHWPHDLTQELFSPSSMLGSWVRISSEAWMNVCVRARARACVCVRVFLQRAIHNFRDWCSHLVKTNFRPTAPSPSK